MPEDFVGLSREEGRAKIITKLESMGLLEKVETNLMMVPYGDRSNTIIEPLLTEQWFVRAKKLSKKSVPNFNIFLNINITVIVIITK